MKRIILAVLSVITGLLFINSGLNKFLNYMPSPEDLPEALQNDFAALVEIEWLMPLLGTVEIIGGILLFFPRTRALGTLVLIPVAVGILLTHLSFFDPAQLIIPIVIWGVLLWNIFDNLEKFLPLIRKEG